MAHPIITYLRTITVRNAAEREAVLERITADDVVYTHTHAPDVLRGRAALRGLLDLFAVHKPTTQWEPAP